MTNPLASAEFFALEAGECLDRIASLVSRTDPPPAEELFRSARVLRGAALMAGLQPLARSAGALEGLARGFRDRRLEWSPTTGELVARAVEEFRALVGRVGKWEDSDTERAARLARGLSALSGDDAPAGRRAPHPTPDSGVRAFVAREGASIAGALDRAAQALRTTPGDREPLHAVVRRMQSLRGLAEIGDLAPLSEVLDGVELAIADLTRLYAPPPRVDEVMGAASRALTRIARDIADHGRPEPEAPETRRFTDLLLRAFAVEHDVVPIESLFFSGDRDPVSPPPEPVSPPAMPPLGPLELVSHGEHLCHSADLIVNARSTTERDLRFYRVLGTLRSAGTPGSGPLAKPLATFARSAREALAAGAAAHATPALANCLREAGELLRAVAGAGDQGLIGRRIMDLAYQLDGLRLAQPVSPAIPVPREEPAEAVVPIESLAYDAVVETDVVPIETLAPDEQPVVAIEPPAPAADAEGLLGGLERSFRTFDRLRRERGPVPASLDGLLGTATTPPPTPGTGLEETIEIGALFYRGRAALERAVAVRHQLADELGRNAAFESIQPLLQELLDLVPLALAED